MTLLITLFALIAPVEAMAQQATPGGGTKPVPIITGSWRTDDDYPAEALKQRQEGTVGFRLDVDARGRVINCTVTQSSGYAALDSATCRFMTKNKFKPGRDASGAAVASTFDSRFRWELPARSR